MHLPHAELGSAMSEAQRHLLGLWTHRRGVVTYPVAHRFGPCNNKSKTLPPISAPDNKLTMGRIQVALFAGQSTLYKKLAFNRYG